MPSVLHTIRRMTRDDVRPSATGTTKRHGWIGPPRSPSRMASRLQRSPSRSPEERDSEHDQEYTFFGTPRIASSCRCAGCWAELTPLAAHAEHCPEAAAAADRDCKPLPFLPTKRKPPPPLSRDELAAMQARDAYPSPPAEDPPELPHGGARCSVAESLYSLYRTDSGPDMPPPVPEKDSAPATPEKDAPVGPSSGHAAPAALDAAGAADVQTVRAHYEPVSASQLKSLYDEIWESIPDPAPAPPAPTPPPSEGCSSCSACTTRARSRSSAAGYAVLGRSPRRPRRPTLATVLAPSDSRAAPAAPAASAAPDAALVPRTSKRRRAPEVVPAAVRRPSGPSGQASARERRPHPGGPRPCV